MDSIVRVLSYTDRYQDGHSEGIPPDLLTEYGPADLRALADAGSLLVDAGRFIAEFQYALDRDDRP